MVVATPYNKGPGLEFLAECVRPLAKSGFLCPAFIGLFTVGISVRNLVWAQPFNSNTLFPAPLHFLAQGLP